MKSIFLGMLMTASVLYTQYVSAQTGQKTINRVITDAGGKEMLIGECTPGALAEGPFNTWYLPAYDSYVPDSAACDKLNSLLYGKTVKIFMGTWCGDSRREVPRVIKLLDHCQFNRDSLTLIMVGNSGDLYKKSPGHEEVGRHILRVPTIIIEENGVETGRIVEYPVQSLERDMLAILSKKEYKPHYSEQEPGD